jgi:hypothetical protein
MTLLAGDGALRAVARELFGSSPERTLVLLRAAWPAAVGPELARRTEVVTLEAGTLRVRVPDARWRKTLHQMATEILARLSRVAGDLAPRRLGFQEAPPAAATGARSKPTPEKPRVEAVGEPPLIPTRVPALPPPAVSDAAQAIDDPDLRRRFLESATRYLARGGTP